MTYYKIVKNNEVIDVNNKFFRFLKKRLIPISCTPNEAEIVQSSDGQKYYTAKWMKPVPAQLNVELVKVFIISEEEYNSLKEQLQLNEIVVIEPVQEEEKEVIATTEVIEQPKEIQKVVNIRELYEEIRQLKEELKLLKK